MEPSDNEESKFNTVTSAGGSAAAAYKATLIQSAGRYELQEKLGQGGMGIQGL